MSVHGYDAPRLPSGIYAMLVTPMHENEDINFDAMRAQIDWCADQGADGVVVTPSIGEFSCLTETERHRLFEFCAARLKVRYPDLVRVATTADTHTRAVLRHTQAAIQCGYHAAQLIPPYYWIPDEEENFWHYDRAAQEPLPLVAYHNPKLSGVEMSADFLGQLAQLPNVVAIKEVKTDRHIKLEPLFKQVEGRAKIFTTFRAFTTGLALGSGGGFINVFALPFCIAMWRLWHKAKTVEDLQHIERIQNMVNEVFPRGGEDNRRHIGSTKLAATIVTGIPMGAPRKPYMLPDEDVGFEKKLMETLPALRELIAEV